MADFLTNPAAFFTAVRSAYGGLSQKQVAGFNAIIGRFKGSDPRHLAYMLATAWHETDRTMQPIREYGRGSGKKYGTTFYGRGLVQLTWEANYVKAGTKLGLNLRASPDLALEATVAADIMFLGMTEGWFTGRKLGDYFGATTDDPVGARRIINGSDKAEMIAGYHRTFLAALKKGMAAVAAPKPTAPPKDTPGPIRRLWSYLTT